MHGYQLVKGSSDESIIQGELSGASSTSFLESDRSKRRHLDRALFVLSLVAATFCGFAAGRFSFTCTSNGHGTSTPANRIPLPSLETVFTYDSEFSKEPPVDSDSIKHAEPIWDSLIPNGLGYFKDPDIAPETSIPTVFHQLHCLYTLRRAYYSSSGDGLEEFDFGQDRAPHVAHCFDYLQQGLRCMADTTIEPAHDEVHQFLGSGLKRQCADFEELKRFVEQRRVFNASGFLAVGLDHGHFRADDQE